MSFDTYAAKSNYRLRTLVELDITVLNVQWVNAGAGIWYVNFSATYPEIDDPDLNNFTVQTFGAIGSITVDNVLYTKVTTIAALTTTETSYFYDSVAGEVYIHFVNNDDPILHTTKFGTVYGYSYNEFTPLNSNTLYQGRIASDISIGESRDPMFFGKIQYTIGSVSLYNADGYFDALVLANNLYGNEVRIYLGFQELDESDYIQVLNATVEKVTLAEDICTLNLSDKRKQLSKSVEYRAVNKNALECIRELLSVHYNASYNDSYYDTTAWALAEASAPSVTIRISDSNAIKDQEVIGIIEDVCYAYFGIFTISAEGKYSFRVIDTSASASSTITANDIINSHSIDYDPLQVISSAKVGYDKNWNDTYESPYTFYYDTTQEQTVFNTYKVYNQKQFNTILLTLADATAYATKILNYAKDVHGTGTIQVPIKYYDLEIGDLVDIEINRPKTTMLGTKKCEIVSKSISLQTGFIDIGYRIV